MAGSPPNAGKSRFAESTAAIQLAELSRRFLSLPAGEIDDAIQSGVEEIGQLTGADSAFLFDVSGPVEGALDSFYEWRRTDSSHRRAPASTPEQMSVFRWSTAKLLIGETIDIRSAGSLPPEAAAEAQDMLARNVGSVVGVPLRCDDELLGYLTVECTEPEAFSERAAELLAIAGGIFGGLIRRRQAETMIARQLEVERTLADVSRRFIECESSEIGSEIDSALETISMLAGADRGYVLVIDSSLGRISDIHEWRAQGVESAVEPERSSSRGRFGPYAWSRDELARGDVLHVPDVSRLPEAATGERRDLHRRGAGSALGFAIRWQGAMIGFLAFETVGRRRSWSEQEITRIGLAAGIFSGALRRQRAEEVLARQLAYEKRAAALSRQLLTLDAQGADRAIRSALAQAAELAGAERSYLLHFPAGRSGRLDIHQWCAPGVLEAEPRAVSWMTGAVLRGEVIHVPSVDELDEKKRATSGDLLDRGVVSLLGFPVHTGEQLVGFVGFERFSSEKSWSDQEISLLELVGEFFAGALGRKAAEEALRSSQTQLQQAQKMEAVGRLAGGVAHDFNNLLTVILGNSDSLVDRLSGADRADAEEIRDAANRAATLTSRLLAFSSLPIQEPDRVDLTAVVSGMKHMLSRLIGSGVDLGFRGEGEPAWVSGHASQLEQVLVNLVVNARNALPETGGMIRVETALRPIMRLEARRTGLEVGAQVVVLSVEDNGVGMDVETRARIFEPFFTTREPGEGTGLGLSIVYSIVRQNGGVIDVITAPGRGTRFDIYLPNVEARRGPQERPRTVTPRTGSGTILLVEDEGAVRRLGRRVLERGGYRVLEAKDGAEAVEVASAHEGPLDLLITDVVMPRMGGAELARTLVVNRPGLAILYISGYPHERNGTPAWDRPDGAILPKPFTGDRLLDKVAELTERAREDPSEANGQP